MLIEDTYYVGSAFWILERQIAGMFRLDARSGSFSAEIIAIDRALDFALTQTSGAINVCLDSRSCFEVINNYSVNKLNKPNNSLNPGIGDIINKIDLLQQKNTVVKFTWCPTHVGIEGNEMADRLAKLAAKSGMIINNKLSFSEILSNRHRQYGELDKQFVDSVSPGTGSYYMEKFQNVKVAPIRKIMRNNKRLKWSLISRTICGYTFVQRRLFRLNLADSPICDCGESPQDINHIAWSCPCLVNPRKDLIRVLRECKLLQPFSIEYLIGNMNNKIACALSKFLIEAQKLFNTNF
ncbi:hypothetical protein ALC62_04497 [Cyphomyrmex costatus]|uniref:RNase H type-1 domain-containing protein n=1 Tax=Cyphomyrmex costatus TaxID=456900 RepID=A0A151IK24_9HYME|nr:hypothetical protein ALC62_04497 [Cyphomyrmex costatus]